MLLPLIEPARPILRKELPRGREWGYELKLDGFRGMFYFDGERALFRSKTMKKMPRFQPLASALRSALHGVTDVILDGEIVVADAERGTDFMALLDASGVPQYAAFDLLWLNRRDLRDRPYHVRKRVLRHLLTKVPEISFVEAFRTSDLLDAVVRMDLEGVVAKRVGDAYGGATEWIKVKNRAYSQAEGRAELFHRSR